MKKYFLAFLLAPILFVMRPAFSEVCETRVSKNAEKILADLNYSSSAEAQRLCKSALKKMEISPEKAVPLFQKAIENDYNFVGAYLGLAEALARAGARGRAKVELTKAKLLNPVLTKTREACIEKLIKKKL